ncbi:hypothetical protein [Mesorhizobium sp. 43Arga]
MNVIRTPADRDALLWSFLPVEALDEACQEAAGEVGDMTASENSNDLGDDILCER